MRSVTFDDGCVVTCVRILPQDPAFCFSNVPFQLKPISPSVACVFLSNFSKTSSCGRALLCPNLRRRAWALANTLVPQGPCAWRCASLSQQRTMEQMVDVKKRTAWTQWSQTCTRPHPHSVLEWWSLRLIILLFGYGVRFQILLQELRVVCAVSVVPMFYFCFHSLRINPPLHREQLPRSTSVGGGGFATRAKPTASNCICRLRRSIDGTFDSVEVPIGIESATFFGAALPLDKFATPSIPTSFCCCCCGTARDIPHGVFLQRTLELVCWCSLLPKFDPASGFCHFGFVCLHATIWRMRLGLISVACISYAQVALAYER